VQPNAPAPYHLVRFNSPAICCYFLSRYIYTRASVDRSSISRTSPSTPFFNLSGGGDYCGGVHYTCGRRARGKMNRSIVRSGRFLILRFSLYISRSSLYFGLLIYTYPFLPQNEGRPVSKSNLMRSSSSFFLIQSSLLAASSSFSSIYRCGVFLSLSDLPSLFDGIIQILLVRSKHARTDLPIISVNTLISFLPDPSPYLGTKIEEAS